MNKEEKKELKKLLLDLVDVNRPSFQILDKHIRLDEDRGWITTEAEILVFGLPRKYLPELHIAWDAYEVLIGLCSGVLPSRIEELLIKARGICPPAKRLNISYEFMECLDFPDWFGWFAKEFFRMPTRGSFAFWEKQSFNTEHLMNFKDDEEEGLLYVATPNPRNIHMQR